MKTSCSDDVLTGPAGWQFPGRGDRRKPQSGIRGLSLVEVVLAMGVLAFVLVSLMGMMALGLKTYRDSADESLCALISRDVKDRLNSYSFTAEDVSATQPSPFNPANPLPLRLAFYYNEEGLFLGTTYTPAGGDAQYRAEAVIDQVDAQLSDNVSSMMLRGVVLTVQWPINPATGLPPAGSVNARRYSFLLSKGIHINSLEGIK
ncbi:hypothetical protein DB346_15265 [Verrucomicrobia bacterium LW23]|nr:hypothetical protein DB346_15265 [Verrucomicrobia bacterium LW23]